MYILFIKVLNYFIDRSLCHVPTWLAAAWWRIHTTEENPKRLVKIIKYLNKGQKTLYQVMNIPIGLAPFIPIQYNPFHTTQQHISFHSFPLLSIPYAYSNIPVQPNPVSPTHIHNLKSPNLAHGLIKKSDTEVGIRQTRKAPIVTLRLCLLGDSGDKEKEMRRKIDRRLKKVIGMIF